MQEYRAQRALQQPALAFRLHRAKACAQRIRIVTRLRQALHPRDIERGKTARLGAQHPVPRSRSGGIARGVKRGKRGIRGSSFGDCWVNPLNSMPLTGDIAPCAAICAVPCADAPNAIPETVTASAIKRIPKT